MSDLELVSLGLTAEFMGIDSESDLFRKRKMEKENKIKVVSSKELQGIVENAVKAQLDQLKKEDKSKPISEYLTIAELSKLLNINRMTIYRWTRKGILQSYGIGQRVYFKRIEIEEALVKLKK